MILTATSTSRSAEGRGRCRCQPRSPAGVADVNQRDGWNRPAAPAFALPTETWREHVARRQRCQELRDKLLAGRGAADQRPDHLQPRHPPVCRGRHQNCEGPELLRAFYQAISTVTVLDPTCGSGAFLFAALNILEPLYEACLDRMQAFVDDLERSGERHHPGEVRRLPQHPGRGRASIRTAATSSSSRSSSTTSTAWTSWKRRSKSASCASSSSWWPRSTGRTDLEPLPDIDFNIRAGNTLVGFVSVDEIRRAAESDATGQEQLVFGETEKAIRRIEEEAEIVERAFQRFHDMQTDYGMDARDFATAKQELRSRLKKLADELDRYLAGVYGVDLSKQRRTTSGAKAISRFTGLRSFMGSYNKVGSALLSGTHRILN